MRRDGVTGLADTDKEWKTGKWENSVGVRMERSVRPLCTGAVFIYTACGNLWAVFSWSP